jgi:HEAT repeat protein
MHAIPVEETTPIIVGPLLKWLPSGTLDLEPSSDGESDPAAISVLIELLDDEDNAVRCGACAIIHNHGPAAEAAVPALRILVLHEDHHQRELAAYALDGIGKGSRPAQPELIQVLEDANPRVNYFAALALGKIGPDAREALPPLRKLLASQRANESCLTPDGSGPPLVRGMNTAGCMASWAMNQIDTTEPL